MIRRILLCLVLALGGAWFVRTYLFEGVWVASGSMEPTLPTGTHYFVNKMVYHLHPPLRGDVIVFKSPVDDQKGLIKRVIALGGDTVEIRQKHVVVNNTPLTEPYAVYKRAAERLIGDTMDPITVPPDSFFVLGDNRDESEDSTTWKNEKTGERIYFIRTQNLQGRLIIP